MIDYQQRTLRVWVIRNDENSLISTGNNDGKAPMWAARLTGGQGGTTMALFGKKNTTAKMFAPKTGARYPTRKELARKKAERSARWVSYSGCSSRWWHDGNACRGSNCRACEFRDLLCTMLPVFASMLPAMIVGSCTTATIGWLTAIALVVSIPTLNYLLLPAFGTFLARCGVEKEMLKSLANESDYISEASTEVAREITEAYAKLIERKQKGFEPLAREEKHDRDLLAWLATSNVPDKDAQTVRVKQLIEKNAEAKKMLEGEIAKLEFERGVELSRIYMAEAEGKIHQAQTEFQGATATETAEDEVEKAKEKVASLVEDVVGQSPAELPDDVSIDQMASKLVAEAEAEDRRNRNGARGVRA